MITVFYMDMDTIRRPEYKADNGGEDKKMKQEQEGWLQTDYQDCNKLMVLLISRMSH